MESERGTIVCVCPICGKEFRIKLSLFKRTKTNCCSKECCYKLRSKIFSGSCNHQYGLKGEKNPTFKGEIIHKTNNHLDESLIYVGDWHKGCTKSGRMTLHRYLVEKNHELFDSSFFTEDNGWHYLKKRYEVHHIDGNHTNNDINNLRVLTKSEHRRLHNKLNPRNRDNKTGQFIK